MHKLDSEILHPSDNIWVRTWEMAHPSNWEAYLIIAAAGILFALVIGSRKDVKEILKDVLRYVIVATVLYFAALAFVYWKMPKH